MALILTLLTVLVLLLGSEIWWRWRKPHDELSRKFIHITVGTFAAFWPYFLEWRYIIALSVAFIVVVGVSLYFGIFKAIHAVERPTWGEFCFAAAVGVLALVTRNPAIYTAALLHMSLADGLAAIIGVKYGGDTRYKVFGHIKSVVGSLTFLLISLTILIGYGAVAPIPLNPFFVVLTSAVAAMLENFAVRGLDNLIVPVFIAGVLMALS